MPITITLKDEDEQIPTPAPIPASKKNLAIKMKLNIRKSLDGSLMIFDHPEVDIVIVPSTKKVVVFPKERNSDEVYQAQDRIFQHLMRAGLLTPGTVEGGNVYGAMSGTMLPADNPDFPVMDLIVLSLGKFIEKEKPDYLFADAYDEEVDEMYTEPNDEDSTPLGKVPQAVKKGSISPYDTRRYLSGYY
tara:strand:+ start:3117 stop:3683 length:567 start_codon:yes stop_codon:yes gene_type:complete